MENHTNRGKNANSNAIRFQIPVLVRPLFDVICQFFEVEDYLEARALPYTRGPTSAYFIIKLPEDLNSQLKALTAHRFYSENNIKPIVVAGTSLQSTNNNLEEKYLLSNIVFKQKTLKEKIRWKNAKWNILLLVATILCIGFSAWFLTDSLYSFFDIQNGQYGLDLFLFIFSAIAVFILPFIPAYLYAAKNGIAYPLPYFIPIPPIPGYLIGTGTLGSVSKMTVLFPDRDKCFTYGILNSFIGLILSIGVLIIGMAINYPSYVDPSALGAPDLFETNSTLTLLLRMLPDSFTVFQTDDPLATGTVFSPMFFVGRMGIILNGATLLPALPAWGGFSSASLFNWKTAKVIAYITGIVLISTISLFSLIGIIIIINYTRREGSVLIQDPISKPHWTKYFLFAVITLLAILSIPFPFRLYQAIFTGQLFSL